MIPCRGPERLASVSETVPDNKIPASRRLRATHAPVGGYLRSVQNASLRTEVESLPERLRQELDKHASREIADYLTDRLGIASLDPDRVLPTGLRELIETIADRMQVAEGNWTLEFRFTHGRLERWFRHHGPEGAAALERFQAV